MRLGWALAVAVAAVLDAGCESPGDGSSARAVPPITLAPCQLAGPGGFGRARAECGTLRVPERRDRPEGRSFDLRIAVVRAERGDRAKDAVAFLAGGPGQAASEQYVGLAPAFAWMARKHDIVLMDQRGTGSSGRLDCPHGSPDALDLDGGGHAAGPTAGGEAEYVRACLDALAADPSAYTTAAAALDLEAVRAALGYEQLSLVGVSYGSRLAMVYARLFPGRVRTMVLDGVAPLEVAIGEQEERNAQAALTALFKRCERDAACGARFHRLAESLEAIVASLEHAPVDVRVPHPRTGELTQVTMTPALLRRTIQLLTDSTETAALLPLLIDDARKSGDLSRLAAQALLAADDLAAGISNPLYLSVICAEDVPFYQPLPGSSAALPRVAAGTVAAVRDARPSAAARARREALCRLWPHASIEPSFKEPLVSDIPTLLLSGSADPVTPPAYGDVAANNLRRSVHVVVRHQGHGSLMSGCLPRLAAEFIDHGGEGRFDPSCVRAIEPAPFFVDFAGPRP
jgi:pimeloyl-ACP methyl ester carboxylesterase